jgi:sortase A
MRTKTFAVCVWLLVASGAFLFTSGLLDYWESRSAQSQIAQEWQDNEETPTATEAPHAPEAPSAQEKGSTRLRSRPVHAGGAVAKLSIPRLETELYVVEGTDDRDLKRGPGHLTGSVMPGADGNCVIAGHRDTHFSVLKNIQDGDEIDLERDGHKYRYRVDGMQVVTPDNTASLQPTKDAVLNLITCYPFHYVGSAPKRFVVHAALEDSTLSASR